MNNVLHRKKWNATVIKQNAEPPPNPIIKIKHNDKSEKDFLKLTLCRDPTSEMSDFYEFKIVLFDNGDPEEFLLFVRNFNMTLEVSGMMEPVTKVYTAVRSFEDKSCVSLTRYLLTWKLQTL